MTTEAGSAAEIAQRRCAELIAWYESKKTNQRRLDTLVQTSVILAAGLTAFAAAIDTWPRWAIVLPAVATTVATGLSTSFRFRNKYIAFATAAERLKWVQLRYRIRAEASPRDPAHLDAFVNDMEAIVTSEIGEWRQGLLSAGGGTAPVPKTGE